MSNTSTDRREADEADDGPIELPEIVPATVDGEDGHDGRNDAEADAAEAASSTTGTTTAGTTTVVRRAGAVPVADPGDVADGWVVAPATSYVAPDRFAPGTQRQATGRRPRVRRVTRVVRHIDPWSTFKVALIFSFVLYGVLLTAGVLLWNVASNTGTVDNVERWFTQFGWDTFELKGGEIFHNAWIAGLFGVVGLTGFAVLTATLFNLVSDIVGGVRLTVLEEEVVERSASSSRRYVVRRPPIDESAGAFDLDGDLGPGREIVPERRTATSGGNGDAAVEDSAN